MPQMFPSSFFMMFIFFTFILLMFSLSLYWNKEMDLKNEVELKEEPHINHNIKW